MRIKEVEDLTGLTRKAIRYYEENGLIQTVKGANGYKEYDEETVKCLLWRLKNYVFWIFP